MKHKSIALSSYILIHMFYCLEVVEVDISRTIEVE